MDYNSWIADLKARGYNTTGLGKNEANFADYGNALSDDIKSRLMQNGKTQADKELQAFVASLFGKKSVMSSSTLMNLCRSKGLKVTSSYKKTTYIMDEKNGASPGKGTKKVRTGSIQMIEITDPKTGAKLVIADSNGNAYIEMEEIFMNEILSGVTSDISAGAAGDSARAQEIEQQKKEKEAQLAKIKEQNSALAKQIGELEEQAEKEIDNATEEIARIEEELKAEIERIRQKWIARYESDPDNYTMDYINSQISSEIDGCTQTANSQIAAQETKINNNEYLAKIDELIAQAGELDGQLLTVNAELTGLGGGNQPQNDQPALNSDGYANQQGFFNGQPNATPTAAEYRAMMENLQRETAYVSEQSSYSQRSTTQASTQAQATAETESREIRNDNDAQIAKKEEDAAELERRAA